MLPASTKYAGQRIAILGMGASGVPAARLAKRLGGEVTVLDTGKGEKVDTLAEKLRTEGFTVHTGDAALTAGHDFSMAVFSPGIDPSWPLARLVLDHSVRCMGEVEFALQNTTLPYIAITGTNGKTTTTELTAAMLNAGGRRTVACGNYGLAVSDVVLANEPWDLLTIEMSSFQLEMIETFRPAVAVWMNFAPDHLDRHPSLDAYRDAKLRIFENQGPDDTAIVNAAEDYPPIKARKVTFSSYVAGGDFGFHDGNILYRGERIIPLRETNLRGLHNAENIMAATGAALAAGVTLDAVKNALRAYHPPAHRCQLAGVVQSREFINDSKATNIHAMESALRGMPGKVVLIAGGKDKQLDYSTAESLVREKASHVFTIGEIGDALARTWEQAAHCVSCGTLDRAVQEALRASSPGQTILFAPGTSSFDQFTGYDHRGRVFTALVEQLSSAAQ